MDRNIISKIFFLSYSYKFNLLTYPCHRYPTRDVTMTGTIIHKHLNRLFDIFERHKRLTICLLNCIFQHFYGHQTLKMTLWQFFFYRWLIKCLLPFLQIFMSLTNFLGDFTPMINEFDFYLNLLDERIDSIVIELSEMLKIR